MATSRRRLGPRPPGTGPRRGPHGRLRGCDQSGERPPRRAPVPRLVGAVAGLLSCFDASEATGKGPACGGFCALVGRVFESWSTADGGWTPGGTGARLAGAVADLLSRFDASEVTGEGLACGGFCALVDRVLESWSTAGGGGWTPGGAGAWLVGAVADLLSRFDASGATGKGLACGGFCALVGQVFESWSTADGGGWTPGGAGAWLVGAVGAVLFASTLNGRLRKGLVCGGLFALLAAVSDAWDLVADKWTPDGLGDRSARGIPAVGDAFREKRGNPSTTLASASFSMSLRAVSGLDLARGGKTVKFLPGSFGRHLLLAAGTLVRIMRDNGVGGGKSELSTNDVLALLNAAAKDGDHKLEALEVVVVGTARLALATGRPKSVRGGHFGLAAQGRAPLPRWSPR